MCVPLFALLIAGSVCSINAQTVVEYNDFSAGAGNWVQKNMGAHSGQVTFQNGWVRITPGLNAGLAQNTCTPLALCYKLPTGDFTFLTRFHQQYWGVCQGECHPGGSTVMLTNSIDKPTAYIATLSASATSGGRPGIDLVHQLSTESYQSESYPILPLNIVAANVVPTGKGLLIKITCVKGAYSFFGSADSVTWQQIGATMKDAFAYACLINTTSPDGWSEFDFGEVIQASTTITNRSQVQPKHPREIFSIAQMGLRERFRSRGESL